MSKTVLCVVGVDQSDDDLNYAINFCEGIGAHLSAFVVSYSPPLPMGEYGLAASDIWAQDRQESMEKLAARVAIIEAIMAKAGVSADVESAYSDANWLGEDIARRAMYSDITLLGAGLNNNDAFDTTVVDGTLFGARNPILVVPAGAKLSPLPKRVMIAWDSRVEASRAVHEALDLLVRAEEVHVILVDPQALTDKNGSEPGADIAAYLARHGINVTVERLPSAGHSVSDVLRQHAIDMTADMIVMGAYGHSRLRERIFGGVTKSMIDKPPLPLFMAR